MALGLKLMNILRNVAFFFWPPDFLKGSTVPEERATGSVRGRFFGLDGGAKDCSLTNRWVCFTGILYPALFA